MSHGKAGAGLDRPLGRGQRIAAVKPQETERLLEMVARTGGSAAQPMALKVADHLGTIPLVLGRSMRRRFIDKPGFPPVSRWQKNVSWVSRGLLTSG
jgi:hypothetical protein